MYSRCLLLSLPAAPLTFAPHNKRAPLNALYGVKVGVLESCHLIGSEDFAIPQSLNVGIQDFPVGWVPTPKVGVLTCYFANFFLPKTA